MHVQPYLFFNGRCEEALDFYRAAVGADVTMLVRYGSMRESSQEPVPPGFEDKVMHARVKVGDSIVLVSDGRGIGPHGFQNFALSLTTADQAEAAERFRALAESGSISRPLSKTFFSPLFGMLVDRFGVTWIVYVIEA